MRWILPIALLALLAAAGPATAEQRAAVTLEQCATGAEPEQRAASFVARMRHIAGADRMRLRFHLQHRSGGGTWRAAGALGGWRAADPGVGAYIYTKRVENLALAGEYRVVVRFRWLDTGGAPVSAALRASPACRQPDWRANLRPVAVLVERGADGTARYRVRVRNSGATGSGAFGVTLMAGGAPLAPDSGGPALAAGDSTMVQALGPACPPGAVVTAVVDGALAIDERREDDNALSAPCPAG